MTKLLKERNFSLKLFRLIDIYSVYVTVLKVYRQNGELLQDVRKLPGLVLEQFLKRLDYEVKVVRWLTAKRLVEAIWHNPTRNGISLVQCLVQSATIS